MAPPPLTLVRLGIGTYQEAIIYMRSDCHVCRSEGFEARSRVKVSLRGKSLPATLNTIESDLLQLDQASLSEVAWSYLGAREGDPIEVTHPDPIESESFLRAKVYGEATDIEAADTEARHYRASAALLRLSRPGTLSKPP